jgi:hypothetical protein
MFCNTLMPPLVSPSTLANFETIIVPSLSVGSDFLASLRAPWFRISTRSPSVISWLWEFRNSKTCSASYLRSCALSLINCI